MAERDQRGDAGTRKTVRFSEEEAAWLEGQVRAARPAVVGVGTIVRGLVQRAMAGDEVREVQAAIETAAGLRPESTAAARRVPPAAAPVPRPGAAAPPRVKLEVVVARRLAGPVGPIPPARLADARRMVKAGRAAVRRGDALAVERDPNALVVPAWVEVTG